MMVIGVTGGMASGKTTLARMFAGPSILHIDADAIVHKLMREDRATREAIAEAFPDAVINNKIDRGALAQAVGKNEKALSALEHILHPRVRAVEENAIAIARRNRLRAVILDVPLLFETDADQLCDLVIVAHAPLKLRRQRAFARPGMNEVKWQRLIARQLPHQERLHRADIIITTALGKAVTRRVVKRLLKTWKLG
jgi:dephospho-CoA kinase